MTSIGKKLNVSSSYLARTYTRLNVPRPAPGYWAKVAARKTPFKPKLPAALPGAETIWDRSNFQNFTTKPSPAVVPINPSATPKRVTKALKKAEIRHLKYEEYLRQERINTILRKQKKAEENSRARVA